MIKTLLSVLLLTSVSAMADFMDNVDRAKHIYGDKVSSKDLKGKVILLEYWGVN